MCQIQVARPTDVVVTRDPARANELAGLWDDDGSVDPARAQAIADGLVIVALVTDVLPQVDVIKIRCSIHRQSHRNRHRYLSLRASMSM